jgi:hypothetical protein
LPKFYDYTPGLSESDYLGERDYLGGTINQDMCIFYLSIFDGPLICSNSYGLGDGFVYFIASASGTSRLRRLGLTYMSGAWKEHMLTHYDIKKPDRKPRRPQRLVDRG